MKYINEINQKIQYQKVLQSRVRGEVNEALKLFGRNSEEVALKTKELEEIDKQILGYSVKLDTIKQKQSNLRMRRDLFRDEWSKDNLFPSAIKMLEL